MAVNIEKFPFKWMPSMIVYLEKRRNEPFKSFMLSKVIGTCNPDTNEIAKMLNYLTHFGRISKNEDNTYFIEYLNKESPPGTNFRFKYIEKLDRIITILKEKTVKLEELAHMLEREPQEVEKDIKFLKLITNKGYVCLDGGKYNFSIYFTPWTKKDTY